jgi:predicted ABC-type ATPase
MRDAASKNDFNSFKSMAPKTMRDQHVRDMFNDTRSGMKITESVSFKAARLMLNELDEYTKAGESFAFETTLSGAHYLQRIQEWKDLGYSVKLWFIALSSPELAISRVKERVAQGGHNIPEEVIRRRYTTGLENLPKYQKVVKSWVLLNGDKTPPEQTDQG